MRSICIALALGLSSGCVAVVGTVGSSATDESGHPGGMGGQAPVGGLGGVGGVNTAPGTGGTNGPSTIDCKGPIVSAGASVRLSDRQFRNSLAALFPFPVDAGSKYPKFVSKGDYSTSISGNDVLFQDIQNFAETAESIALQAIGRMDRLPSPAGRRATRRAARKSSSTPSRPAHTGGR